MRRIKPVGLLHWWFHPGPQLTQRVVHAGSWVFISRASVRSLSLSRTVILARLLTPEDFGVMAIALVVRFFLEVATSAGFGAALVQRQGDIRDYLDTAWSLNILRGVLLATVLLLGAPYFASFFHATSAVPVMQVMALAVFLQSLSNPGMIYFQKDLEFHRRFQYEATRTIVEVGVAITLAVALKSVWALAFGVLAGEFVGLLVSYLIHPYRPHLRIEWPKARELYRFGRWVYLGALLDAVSTQVDRGIVARLLGTASLGMYQMATRLSHTLPWEISYGVYSVAFPSYARIQDETHRLRIAYLRTLEVVASLMIPFAVAVFFLGDDFVAQVLGDQWLPAVPAMKVLAFAGCLRSLTAPLRALLYGVGRPMSAIWINTTRNVVLIASVYPLASSLGVTGAAFAVLLASLGTAPLQIRYAMSILQVQWRDLFQALLPALAISGATGAVLLVSELGLGPSSLANLALAVGLALPVYIGSAVVLWYCFKIGPLRGLMMLK